jgi:hypothetical protein
MSRSLKYFRLLRVVMVAAGILWMAAATVQGAETNRLIGALRPFYLIGHGANTLALAKEYLDAGANALEVDVNLMAGQTNVLCIGHGPDLGGGAPGKNHSVPLADFLRGLHELARTNPAFCLVYFDCKSLVVTPEHGTTLLNTIRTALAGDGTDHVDMNVLISVGKLKEKVMFANLTGQLGPHEGLMVDGYSDPAAVSAYFTGAGVTNQAFSDGIVPMNPLLNLITVHGAVRAACRLRDTQHQIRFVGVWSVNNPWAIRHFIRMGVDGLVVDRHIVWYNFCMANLGNGLRSLTKAVRDEGNQLGIRPANRADNLFAIHAPAVFDNSAIVTTREHSGRSDLP